MSSEIVSFNLGREISKLVWVNLGAQGKHLAIHNSLYLDTLLKELVAYFAYLNFSLFSCTFLENSPNTILNGTFSGGTGEIFDVVFFLDLQYVLFSMLVYHNKSTKGL